MINEIITRYKIIGEEMSGRYTIPGEIKSKRKKNFKKGG